MTRIEFEFTQTQLEGGFKAKAIGCGMFFERNSTDEGQKHVSGTCDCLFSYAKLRLKSVWLHVFFDGILAA